MDKASFLQRNRVTEAEFKKASIDWGVLLDIYNDYCERKRQLEDAADFFVKSMQAFRDVHSVRWRVKDPEHLIEKIIRKRCEAKPSKKYMEISKDNYHKVITDLVGVRALHLFKDQVFQIHDQIKGMWGFNEKAVSYIREGDPSDLVGMFAACGITPKIHPAGYRSVHYVLKTKPGLKEVLVELQIRTIFEEAWSEIDHKIRYPNFSDNKQIESILKIFNRLSGSADEIGGFIRNLSAELNTFDDQIAKAAQDRDNALDEMQKLVSEFESVQQENSAAAAKVKLLQVELNKVKKSIQNDIGRDVVNSWKNSNNSTFIQQLARKGILFSSKTDTEK